MSYVVQANKASDSDKPPSYRDVDDSGIVEKGRVNRSGKPEEHYSLAPVKNPRKSLDDTLPLDCTSEKFHHLTSTLPAGPSAP